MLLIFTATATAADAEVTGRHISYYTAKKCQVTASQQRSVLSGNVHPCCNFYDNVRHSTRIE